MAEEFPALAQSLATHRQYLCRAAAVDRLELGAVWLQAVSGGLDGCEWSQVGQMAGHRLRRAADGCG